MSTEYLNLYKLIKHLNANFLSVNSSIVRAILWNVESRIVENVFKYIEHRYLSIQNTHLNEKIPLNLNIFFTRHLSVTHIVSIVIPSDVSS